MGGAATRRETEQDRTEQNRTGAQGYSRGCDETKKACGTWTWTRGDV